MGLDKWLSQQSAKLLLAVRVRYPTPTNYKEEEMIVDYQLSPKHRPTERAVWLMSKSMEKDGITPNMSIMRALESGEIKYINHKIYKLCRHCMDYLPLDNFYDNKRYVMGKAYICKSCQAIRRRIKQYGTVNYITEVGMDASNEGFGLNLKPETMEILRRRLDKDGDNNDITAD